MRPSRYKALYGGRGSAKSHFFAECMVANALSNSGFRGVCVREVQKSLKESAKRLIEDKITQFGASDQFDCLTTEIKTPGGGVIIFQGMQDHTAETIKSLEGFHVAWVEEGQTLSSRSLEMLRPTIRAPGSELWFSWNPRSARDPVDAFFRGEQPPENAIIAKINYDQNRFFPEELEQERVHDKATKPERYAHIWLGEYEPMVVGAIWSRQVIHEGRRDDPVDLERIIVAVDPATSSDEDADEHGIIVVGRGEDGRGYVIEDGSLKGTPRQWANRAVSLYDKYSADRIVYERNQGGEMVEHTLRTVRQGLPLKDVWAARGKHVRAEPIAALYEAGRVSHVGTFERLEDQMTQMTAAGYEGDGSPDRVDALVWGLTELFPQMIRPKKRPVAKPRAIAGGWMG
jgi:phage terminase large subunit-like protein